MVLIISDDYDINDFNLVILVILGFLKVEVEVLVLQFILSYIESLSLKIKLDL